MNAQFFVLYTGYVESASMGAVLLWHPEGFPTVMDALSDLGGALLEDYTAQVDSWLENQHNQMGKCTHCGNHPYEREEVDLEQEELANHFKEFARGSAEEGAHELWAQLHDRGWSLRAQDIPPEIWVIPVIITEAADELLAKIALGDFEEESKWGTLENWLNRSVARPVGIALR